MRCRHGRLHSAAIIVGAVFFVAFASVDLAAAGQPTKLGLVYPGPHPLVDDVKNGLRAGLKEAGLAEGKDYEILEKSAAGDPANFSTVSQAVIAGGADILVPIATPTAQAAVKENGGRLPVVFIAVTDPVGAGILKDMERPGDNITGVSDAWPFKDQLLLIKAIMPNAKKIGVMYNPSEANSVYGIKIIRELSKPLNLDIVDGTVAGASEISTRAGNLIAVDHVDAIFLSSDNTLLGAAEAAIKAGEDRGVPVFSGDSGTVKRGAVASASIGYVGVGQRAGSLIARIIHGEKAGTIPVVVATGGDIYINLDAAKKAHLVIPQDVLSKAKVVYGQADAPPINRPAAPAEVPASASSRIGTYVLVAVIVLVGLVVMVVLATRRRPTQTK